MEVIREEITRSEVKKAINETDLKKKVKLIVKAGRYWTEQSLITKVIDNLNIHQLGFFRRYDYLPREYLLNQTIDSELSYYLHPVTSK